jgi:hypothetical protein
VTWAVYTFQLVARRTIGWRGRRSAYLSAVGFAIVLLNFVLVSYFLTDSHNFGARDVAPPTLLARAGLTAGGPAHGLRAAAAGRRSIPHPRAARPAPSNVEGRSEALREAALRPKGGRSERGLSRRDAPRQS